MLLGCSTSTQQTCARAEGHKRDLARKPGGPTDIAKMLPGKPAGFDAAIEVSARNRETIFEQINGGSVSFLDNGLTDALFATYLRTGGDPDSEAMAFEVYRFDKASGALAQFKQLNGNDGKPWEESTAVIHDYGVELVDGSVIVRATFNDGPPETMIAGAKALALEVLKQTR
jgi:hypothetical protein